MKIRLHFKTPDVVDSALEGLPIDEDRMKAKRMCEGFVMWGECLTVEVDTEKGTCEVIPV